MRQAYTGQTPILSERSDRYFLLLVTLWLWLPSMIRPLTVPDEGRYADVARWMLVSGDWLTPRLDGLPFFHKPPVLYWIDATLFSLFGVSPEVARLAPVFAGVLTVLVTFWFLRRRLGSAFARTTTLVLVTSLLFFGGSQYVNHDMMVAAWITLGTLFFTDGLITGEKRSYILGYAACALALMSKGMIGVALPGLVLLPWMIATGRWRQIPQLLNPIGLLVFFAIALPWFVLMQREYPGFFHYFFIEQQFQRYTTGSFNNKQHWWFYIACLLVSFMPWLFQLGTRKFPERLRISLGGELAGLMAWWVVAITGFFSIPVSKLPGYVLPVTVPLAVLIAALIHREAMGRARRLAGPVFSGIIGAGLVLAATVFHPGDLTPGEYSNIALLGGGLLGVGIVLGIMTWKGRMPVRATTAAAAAAWLLAVVMAVAIGDHRNNSQDTGIKPYLTPSTQLVFYKRYFYDLPFLLNWPKAVAVVEDWPSVNGDNWAQELKDGTPFDAAAAQNLWDTGKLIAAEQSGQRLLILVPRNMTAPGLEHALPVFHARNFEAFLIPGRGTPRTSHLPTPPLPSLSPAPPVDSGR